MGVGDEEYSSSKELNIAVDSKGVFKDMDQNYRIWKNSETTEYLGNLGIDHGIRISGGPFDYMHLSAGTGSVYHEIRDNALKAEFEVSLSFDDKLASLPNKGYVGDEELVRMQKLLEDQGFESISVVNNQYDRFFSFSFREKKYKLEIGRRNLDEDVKSWEKHKIGDQPTHNSRFSLSLVSPETEAKDEGVLPFSEREYAINTSSLINASKRVIWMSEEFYGLGKSSCEASFESLQLQKERRQRELGFSITDYEGGEFDVDGKLGERIYADVDNLYWRKDQGKIYEWRSLGNRQILTMYKDRLVFGRWAGVAASEGGTQADVLIDQDIDPQTHKEMKELGVSRRHFAISSDERVKSALKETTGGLLDDALVFEDLNPTNETVIIRREESSRILFGSTEFVEKGGKSVILPGDLILVGSTGNIRAKEDWINHQSRGIGLVYLGDRKFVKVVVGERDSDLVADLLALTDTTALNRYLDEKGAARGKMGDILDGEGDMDPVIMQALRVVEKSERKLQALEGYSQEQIKQMDPKELLDLIGNVEVGSEQTLEHALFAVTTRDESNIVGYALATALRIGGFDESVELLSKPDVWKKLPGIHVLQALDYIETADISDEQKAKFCNIAYTSRDDGVKLLIRKRIERYSDKGITSLF